MRRFLLIVPLFSFVATSCFVFHFPNSQPTSSSSMIIDYMTTKRGMVFTPIEPELIKPLPRNSIIAFRGDDEVDVEQLVKHQRLYSREGFSTFAIIGNTNEVNPVFFYGFAEKHIRSNDECYTFLMTTNALVHLAALRTGIGEKEIPKLPSKLQNVTFDELAPEKAVEIVCQGSVPVRCLLNFLQQINPKGIRDVYLLYY